MIYPRISQTGQDVAAHYDGLDRFYREIWGEHVHHGLWRSGRESAESAVRELIDVVARHAQIKAGQVVCDAGCGYGGTARILARDYGAQVIGLTISRAQHAYATGLDPSASNPVYLLRDWCDNGLSAEQCDAVIAIESSEHMADKEAFFAEAFRVLKPAGRLVVCAWLARPGARRFEVSWLLEPICREGRLPSMGTADEYAALAERAGLELINLSDVSRAVKRTWPTCAWRAIKRLFQEPDYRRFLFLGDNPDRLFALTLFRIWLAYETGSMRYGVLTAQKPGRCPARVDP
jgi:tocopherol O-methyltransferase